MSDHYILVDRVPVACDMMTWARWLDGADRVVALTNTDNGQVSTVFLGLNHAFCEGGPPLLFETLVFGGTHDGDMWRYSTWDEAEYGHTEAVKLCQPTGE